MKKLSFKSKQKTVFCEDEFNAAASECKCGDVDNAAETTKQILCYKDVKKCQLNYFIRFDFSDRLAVF